MKLERHDVVSPPMSTVRSSRWLTWLADNPLAWALPLQAILLFYNLDFLDPWRDEQFTLTTVSQPLAQIRSWTAAVGHPPLYFFLLHYWIRLPFPASVIWKLRAMSVLWAIAGTIALYFLWLSLESRWTQRVVLALWVLSPCMLLYSRMARSYSMQLAIALLLIATALRWMEQPRSPLRLLTYSILAALLLYIHYLPGLSIVAATAIVFAFKRGPSIGNRAALLALATLVTVLLFFPELPSMSDALQLWHLSGSASSTNAAIDQAIRLAWWFVSFSFGESLSSTGVLLGLLLSPIVLVALYGGLRQRPQWLGLVGLAAFFGYLGVTRWTSFPFTPARQLFVLPFFLILVVNGIRTMRAASVIVAAMVLLYIVGSYGYFTRAGFLNKEYCTPYSQMAEVINRDSPTGGAVLLVDENSVVSGPLGTRLAPGIRVIGLENEEPPIVLELEQNPSKVIWLLRHGRDASPDQWISGLERRLREKGKVTELGFLPYSAAELRILTMLRGPDQPHDFYTLLRFTNSGTPEQSR